MYLQISKIILPIQSFFRKFQDAIFISFFPMAALTLWISVRIFAQSLISTPEDEDVKHETDMDAIMESTQSNLNLVLEGYEAIKKLSDAINKTFGQASLYFIIEAILVSSFFIYNRVTINGEIVCVGWTEYLGIALYEVNFIFILLMCADTCHVMVNML